MDYNLVLTKFCERKLYPERPEYLNAISALYISAIGYYNVLKFYKVSKTITLIYLCIITNGIGSFAFHWTGWYIYGLLDEFSMILPLWIGIYKILYELEYSKMVLGLFTIYNIILIVLDVFPWFGPYFPIAFAIELTCIIPLYYQVIKSNNVIISKYYLFNNNGFVGISLCSTSALIWVISEKYCNKYLILGHSIWHIGMSTGLCNIINFFHKKTLIFKIPNSDYKFL